MSTDLPQTTAVAIHDDDTLDRIACEIGAQMAAQIEKFYPAAVDACGERMLFNVKAWARGEVLRWFGKPDHAAASATMDARLRAAAAHRRHIKRLQTLAGAVQPGDAVDPIMAAMNASARQAQLDYRAGGPVIEGGRPDE